MERVEVTFEGEVAGDLAEYAREEHLPADAAAEKLLAEALSRRRRDRAVERFAAGELSFTEAADRAELSPWRFADLLRERDVS